MVQVHRARVITGESQNSWVWFRSSGLRTCGGGKRLGPFYFFYLFICFFHLRRALFRECCTMLEHDRRRKSGLWGGFGGGA